MIIQDIKNSSYIYFVVEDSIEIAKESERLAYIRGDAELAEAYALIAELLEHNLELTEELDR